MSFTVSGQCFIENETDLIIDGAGNKIQAKTVILCKKKAFIITEDGDIDWFSVEDMDVVY